VPGKPDQVRQQSFMILEKEFYKQDTLTVARELLGAYLVHEVKKELLPGK
jgi:3-methyladenine DNA glycosylase Mpg